MTMKIEKIEVTSFPTTLNPDALSKILGGTGPTDPRIPDYEDDPPPV